MDRLGEITPPATPTPTTAGCPPGASCPARTGTRRPPTVAVERARPLTRGRHRQPGVRAAVPRLQGRQGHLARRDRRLHQRDRPVPQPVAVPPRGTADGPPRPTRSSRTASARSCARSWPRPRPTDLLVPQVVYGYFAGQRRRRRPRHLDRRDPHHRAAAVLTSPASSKAPFLCIADFFRPVDVAARSTTPRSTSSPWAQRCRERTAELFAADKYQDYLLLHGLGVEMAEALAEYWHHRIREEWGFADEDGPTLAGLFRQQYRGGRYSWGYPACPDLEDNAQRGRAARRRPHRRRGAARRPASSTSPSRPPRRIICHHPQAKYFVAR